MRYPALIQYYNNIRSLCGIRNAVYNVFQNYQRSLLVDRWVFAKAKSMYLKFAEATYLSEKELTAKNIRRIKKVVNKTRKKALRFYSNIKEGDLFGTVFLLCVLDTLDFAEYFSVVDPYMSLELTQFLREYEIDLPEIEEEIAEKIKEYTALVLQKKEQKTDSRQNVKTWMICTAVLCGGIILAIIVAGILSTIIK